jgi:hypothetical protein
MRQKSHNRGGAREGGGRPTAVPSGAGTKLKVTVALGAELLDLMRERWPGMTDQDTVRAALWAAVGQPQAPATQQAQP